MTRLLAILAALAGPAAGQEVRLVPMPAGSDHLAEIRIHNEYRSIGTREITLSDAAIGDVVVSHTVTTNTSQYCCEDSLSILSLPDGIVADVIDLVVGEGGDAVIRLYSLQAVGM